MIFKTVIFPPLCYNIEDMFKKNWIICMKKKFIYIYHNLLVMAGGIHMA